MPDQTTHPLDSLKKIDRLWFDDADVVFCAGNYKFRVSRLILSQQSPIFRDMFSLPLGVSDTIATEDRPYKVITLTDRDRDLIYFFLAIFDGSFYGVPPSEYWLSVTLSVLRLAHKYEVPFLILRAIKHLDVLFPLDLESLENVEYHGSSYHGSSYHGSDDEMNDEDEDVAVNDETTVNSTRPRPRTKAERFEEYFEALTVLDKAGVEWLIPAVLFILVTRFRIAEIMEHPSFDQLPKKHRLLIVMSETNHAMEDDSSNSWLTLLPTPTCTNYPVCSGILRIIQQEEYVVQPRRRAIRTAASISVPNQGKLLKLCQNCQGSGAQYQQGLRQKFWNEYWITYGFDSKRKAEEMRRQKIAEMEMAIAQTSSYDFD